MGSQKKGYGLLYSEDKSTHSYNRLLIAGNGQMQVFTRRNKHDEALISWRDTEVINKGLGARNELLVEIWPKRQRISINGEIEAVVKTPHCGEPCIVFMLSGPVSFRIHEVSLLPPNDVTPEELLLDGERTLEQLMDEFNSLIGLDEVKHELKTLMNMVRVRKKRE